MPKPKQQSVPDSQPQPIPQSLNSTRSKLLYIYIDTQDGATVDELTNELNLKLISILGTLKTLVKENHLTQNGEKYYTVSQPAQPR